MEPLFTCITMHWDKAVNLMTDVVSRINKVFEIYDVTSNAATCTILFLMPNALYFQISKCVSKCVDLKEDTIGE